MDPQARMWLSSCGSGANGVDIYTGSSNTNAPSLRMRVAQSGSTEFYGPVTATSSSGTNAAYSLGWQNSAVALRMMYDANYYMSIETHAQTRDLLIKSIAADGTGDLTIAAAPLTVGQLDLGDDAQIRLGDSQDLLIFHDSSGSVSVIRDAGTGGLDIRASAVSIENDAGTETMATFAVDGAVTLYHDNTAVFATASDGIDVTGKVDASGAIEGVGATITGSTTLTSLGVGVTASGTTGELSLIHI